MKRFLWAILGVLLLAHGAQAYQRTIVNPAANSAVSSAVIRSELQTLENEITSLFTFGTTQFATTSAATSTAIWAQMGLFASSTSYFSNLVSVLATSTNFMALGSTTLQNFTASNSTTTNATSSSIYISGNASTTHLFGTDVNGFGLTSCTGAAQAIRWTGGSFSCGSVSGTASTTLLTDNNGFSGLNTFTDLKLVTRSTTTNATTTGSLFTNFLAFVTGSTTNLTAIGSTTLQNFTASDATLTNATTSGALSIGSNLVVTLLGKMANLLVTGSSTLQNFTGLQSTTTNSTSTNSFATTASSTNLFSTSLNTGLITSGNINSQTISSAANFTGTVGVTTSLTSPIVIGGSGAGSSLELRTTSGTGVGAEFITLTAGSNGNLELARFTGGKLIGFGTSTPQWALQISTTSKPQITFSDSGFITSNHWGIRNSNGIFYLATSSPTTYATSSVAALAIDANGQLIFQNFRVNASSTLQNFTGINSTTTNATTTTLYVSTFASTTAINSNSATIGNLTVGSCTGCSGLLNVSTTSTASMSTSTLKSIPAGNKISLDIVVASTTDSGIRVWFNEETGGGKETSSYYNYSYTNDGGPATSQADRYLNISSSVSQNNRKVVLHMDIYSNSTTTDKMFTGSFQIATSSSVGSLAHFGGYYASTTSAINSISISIQGRQFPVNYIGTSTQMTAYVFP